MYACVLCACLVPAGTGRECCTLELELWIGSCGCWDLNPHPLSERQVSLIAEPSLHPWLHTFLKESSLFLLSDIFLPVDVQWSYGLCE